jgi:SAM-dependent methyltransferase
MSARGGALAGIDTMAIMAPLTLANSHPTLLRVLQPGMSVLDVGCGPGTLTTEIARRVDPAAVVGMDANPEMIRAAEEVSPPGAIPNLIFYASDIRESEWHEEWDVVNAARSLQWIPDPIVALRRMVSAAVAGGLVVVLDVDHTRAGWNDPPRAWTRFHQAFLAWRESCRLDNAVGGHLSLLCDEVGIVETASTSTVTIVRADDHDFFRAAGRWRMMIESRGRQMVAAGYLAETDRRHALDAFTEWMNDPNSTQTVHETCIVARRP